MGLRATVRNGRLVLDEATALPDGTVVDLVLDDEDDELDDEQRRALDAAITASLQQAERGETATADKVLAHLRARRPDLSTI